MSDAKVIYFLADLHLAPGTPGACAIFSRFLSGPARSAQAIFLLGDLFDAWVGDDDLTAEPGAQVAAALRDLTDRGVSVGLMGGNRDFLLGKHFAIASGVQLLDDPYLLETATGRLLLSHGDILCTADTAYQEFRRLTRQQSWQEAFLARPLSERRAIAARLRAESESCKINKIACEMDVSQDAVEACLAAHGGQFLIHGHTHRPDRHDWQTDGRRFERWVLGDWHEDRGDCMKFSDGVFSRLTLR